MAAQTMKAAVVQADKTTKVEQKPVPAIKGNEILLKVVTVGLNPTDWKTLSMASNPGDILGCDFVGTVFQIGADVPTDKVKKGELRWGFMRGGVDKDRGGFAEYVPVEWDISGVVPRNITPQQAASIPIPFVTAVQALYLRLGLPQPPEKSNGQWILIWSGATAVGQYAIQLAKLSGLKVATTASETRWPTLKALGADVVVDYKDTEVIEKLKKGTDDSIEFGLDCVSVGGSTALAQRAFRPAGGHLITLLPFNANELPRSTSHGDEQEVRTEVTLAYTALGTDVDLGGQTFTTSPEDRALFVEWANRLTGLLQERKIKPLQVDVMGGLDKLQETLDILKSGNHKHKMVLNVQTSSSLLQLPMAWIRRLLRR